MLICKDQWHGIYVIGCVVLRFCPPLSPSTMPHCQDCWPIGAMTLRKRPSHLFHLARDGLFYSSHVRDAHLAKSTHREVNNGGPGTPWVAVRCHADGTSREAAGGRVNHSQQGLNLKTQKLPSLA